MTELPTREEFERKLIAKVKSDDGFRKKLIQDPKKTIEQTLGLTLPEQLDIVVHEERRGTLHLVLPPSDELTESELDAIAGGESWNGFDWHKRF